MIFRRWGLCALTLLFGFSLVTVDAAYAARTVASGKQVKKTVRAATKVVAKKRVSPKVRTARRIVAPVAAAPIFRPPKAPAQRHYAVDGTTFYADGVRVRAAGLEGLEMSAASSVAKLQLQQMLDSGRVSIEPIGSDGGDVTVARVRIDGRDVSELARMR